MSDQSCVCGTLVAPPRCMMRELTMPSSSKRCSHAGRCAGARGKRHWRWKPHTEQRSRVNKLSVSACIFVNKKRPSLLFWMHTEKYCLILNPKNLTVRDGKCMAVGKIRIELVAVIAALPDRLTAGCAASCDCCCCRCCCSSPAK